MRAESTLSTLTGKTLRSSIASAVLPEAVGPIKKYRLRQARLAYIIHASGRSSPNVNQQVVTGHPAALSYQLVT